MGRTNGNIMLPFVKTSKLSFLISLLGLTYDTLGDSFAPLESKLLTA